MLLKNPSYSGITPEFWDTARCHLRPQRIHRMGHAKLRQGTADANDVDRSWSQSIALAQIGCGRGQIRIEQRWRLMAKNSLLTESHCQAIVDLALAEAIKLAKSRKIKAEIELSVASSNIATSRFANSEMTQNQAPSLDLLSIRVIAAGRQARQDGGDLSEGGVRQLVREAFDATQLLAVDPDLPPLIAPKDAAMGQGALSRFGRYDPRTAAMTAGDRALAIKQVIALAEAKARDRGRYLCHPA